MLCFCRQTEPQATPLSAAAIREAEDSSPPPGPARPEAPEAAQVLEQTPLPSVQQGAAEPDLHKAPLESPRQLALPAGAAVSAVAQHPQVQADTAASPAVAGGAAGVVSSQDEPVSSAAKPPAAESAGQPAVAMPPEQDKAGSASPVSRESAGAEALPVAKVMPEQDRPVPLTPRTPREERGTAACPMVKACLSSPFTAHVPGYPLGLLLTALVRTFCFAHVRFQKSKMLLLCRRCSCAWVCGQASARQLAPEAAHAREGRRCSGRCHHARRTHQTKPPGASLLYLQPRENGL